MNDRIEYDSIDEFAADLTATAAILDACAVLQQTLDQLPPVEPKVPAGPEPSRGRQHRRTRVRLNRRFRVRRDQVSAAEQIEEAR